MSRKVWRIVKDRYAGSAFDGEGARLWGGRWNHPGTPMVYTSESLSLAVLEMFVHVEADVAPTGYVAVAADLPESFSIEHLDKSKLPGDWRSYPAPDSLKDLGTSWIESRRSAVLIVPSVVVPQESNLLLNPLVPGFSKLRTGSPEPFSFDPRMWKEA